jgi:hypothetical protein
MKAHPTVGATGTATAPTAAHPPFAATWRQVRPPPVRAPATRCP